MYEKILTEYQKREPRLLYSYELETFLKHMQAGHITEEQLAKIPKMWKAYINMQGYFGDATVALADFIKDFNRNWKDSQPLDAGICYIYFDTEADAFKLEKSCLGQDFIFCQSLEEGKKLLQVLEQHKSDHIKYWTVTESNPFYDDEDIQYYLYEHEAQEQFDEFTASQMGRHSYDDDFGGMDYSVNAKEDILANIFANFSAKDWLEFF